MSIQTDLSVSPYFDDYDKERDYYKILFRPSVPVQVRELNQLQTLLQKQIEKFGDHILKRGTIVEGCQFTFQRSIPYVKLRDTTSSGAAAIPGDYEDLLVRNSANLVARVIASNTGFESQAPNLKTLYLDYVNSGDGREEIAYSNGDVLTVYNSDKRLYNIQIGSASSGFSNNDSVVILSSIEVQNTTGGTTFSNGTFQVGELITQDTTLAEAVIVGVNATANSTALVLQIRPVTSQLAAANTDSWSFGTGYNFTSNTTGNEATLTGLVGSGATATLSTTGAGAIANVTILTGGSNYYVDPYATVSTTVASTSQINALNLTPNAFVANVVVATVANSTGYAYGVTTTEGTVYQKGYFLRTDPQFLIVDKYANTPNAISVGFTTTEAVVNSSVDSTLVDNAAGFLNQNAPGANRLRLIPTLSLKNFVEADEDPDFLPIIKFSEGRPYFQLQETQYNGLADELARRTYEESGNYVLDRFNMTTRSTLSIANSDTHFSYVVDPGHAYINGYRVRTVRDFAIDVEKSTQTETLANTVFDIIYGNYVLVDEFAGLHAFTAGQQISLRDAAADYISTSPSDDIATIAGNSNEIGKARIRSVMYHGGADQGTPGAVYRIYLFDIKMNAGKNFSSVRSIFTDNTTGVDGIADVIIEPIPGASSNGAVLQLKEKSSLILNTQLPLSAVSNVEYQYRTVDTNLVANTTGFFTVNTKANSVWPYAGLLSSFEENQIIIIPEEDLVDTASISTANATTGTLSGNGFIVALDAGDYIQLDDGSNTAIGRVVSVTNSTSLEYSPSDAFDAIADGADVYRCYPQGIPVPMSRRTQATAQISGNTMTVDLDIDLSASANVSLISNQRFTATSSTSVQKTAARNIFVQIDCSNNVAGSAGPWCLGFSDIFRLKNVYLGSNTDAQNVTDDFYIDHNHTENYYDLGYLYLRQDSSLSLNANTELLVEFDYTTHNKEGIKTVSSYTLNDEVTLDNLTTDVNTLEIPEFVSKKGEYYDLRECLDFRPRTANTVAATTNASAAPINPPEVNEATRFVGSDLLFPVPESDMFCNLTYYVDRRDIIVLNSDGEFEILQDSARPKIQEPNQLTLYEANVPAYPSLPQNLSISVQEILDRKIGSESLTSIRRDRYSIVASAISEQAVRYTMEDISTLEERISILEYYANLSELDDEVKDRVIPSSLDSTLERFKFGFFVDNFIDESFIALDDPEHRSTVYEGVLQPARSQFDLDLELAEETSLEYVDNYTARFGYSRRKLFSQPRATVGSVIDTTDPEPTIANTCIFVSNKTTKGEGSFEERVFVASSNAEADGRNITIEFNVYNGKDRIEIYQSSSPDSGFVEIYNNSTLTPTNLTSQEKQDLINKNLRTNLNSSRFSNTWKKYGNFAYGSLGGNSKYWIFNVGKLTFPYDYSAGRYIKVRVVKGSPHHSYYICFPGDAREYAFRASTTRPSLPSRNYIPVPPKAPVVCPEPVKPKPVVTIDYGERRLRVSPATPWDDPRPKTNTTVKTTTPPKVVETKPVVSNTPLQRAVFLSPRSTLYPGTFGTAVATSLFRQTYLK